MKKHEQKARGFTLLELLVVIGIIGILVSFAAVSYQAAQIRARDSRRRTEIRSIQQAMEQSYASNTPNQYTVCTTGVAISSSNCDITSFFGGGTIPTDPGTSSYTFTASSVTAYTVCANLETGGTFCLSNLQ